MQGQKSDRLKKLNIMSISAKNSKADTIIILNDKGNTIFNNEEIADTFNEYFKSIVESLDLHI